MVPKWSFSTVGIGEKLEGVIFQLSNDGRFAIPLTYHVNESNRPYLYYSDGHWAALARMVVYATYGSPSPVIVWGQISENSISPTVKNYCSSSQKQERPSCY